MCSQLKNDWQMKQLTNTQGICFSRSYENRSIKEVHGKPRLHLSTNLLLGVWPPCCATPPSPAVVRTRPRAIPLPMTTMRKSLHGFHFPYMAMGLRLAALRAAGAPLLLSTKRNSFTCKHREPMGSSRKGKSYIFDSEVILL